MVRVTIRVGVGQWVAVARGVPLATYPHVGDQVVVNDRVITCDTVRIEEDRVEVFEARRFESQADADAYFKA